MSTLMNAIEKAYESYYIPSTHAIDRARLRFGVELENIREWFNEQMAKAKYVCDNGKGRSVYANGNVRLIVHDDTKTIITVYDEVKTDFLRPALERELRKLKRHYTKTIRQHELAYAELLKEIGEMAINRARARNPKTRELIAERLSDKQRQADELITEIERLNDEWQSKVRAIELIAN